MKTQGFTLIEVLVVVLIIGILTSIALPQYQKAVQKSKNANLKKQIMEITQAQEVYYSTYNKYSDSFNALDISLSLPVTYEDLCGISHSGTDSMRGTEDYYIILNNNGTGKSGITGLWKKGPYTCAGFKIPLDGFNQGMENKTFCIENPAVKAGSFCEKLEHGILIPNIDSYRWYEMP